MEYVLIAIAILLVGLVLGVSLLVGRGRRTTRLDDDAAAGTTLRELPCDARANGAATDDHDVGRLRHGWPF